MFTNGLIYIKIKERDYDLFIIDIKMPEVNGMELYEHISSQYPELVNRIVFASGDVMGRETQLFLERTGRPYLFKPFNVSELIETVRDIIG